MHLQYARYINMPQSQFDVFKSWQWRLFLKGSRPTIQENAALLAGLRTLIL